MAYRCAHGASFLIALLVSGCSLSGMAVDTTAGVLSRAESSTRSYFDYESAGDAAAGGIMQLEGLHMVRPENETLMLMLAKAYMAYAYGWVSDERDIAEVNADFEVAEYHQQRAYLMYTRAKSLAMRALMQHDERFATMACKDPKVFRAYLEEEFDDPEKDVEPLFWLMMSWSSAISSSVSSTEFVDMPAIRAIAEWLVVLDEGYEDAGALVFLGGFDSSYPKQLGGDPVKGKQHFERAIALTQRRNHIMLLNYATLYAVHAQDRALFVSLLHEILEAGDQGNGHRLSNKVAKRRAKRLLARVDELFMP